MPGDKKAVTETSLVLPEIACAHCRAGLGGKSLPAARGGRRRSEFAEKRVRIRFDPLQTSEEMIERSLAGLGYSIQL